PKPKGVKPVPVPVSGVAAKNQRGGPASKLSAPRVSPSKQRRQPTVATMPPPIGLPSSYKHKPRDEEAMPATPTTPTPRPINPPVDKNVAETRNQPKRTTKPESIPDINSP